MKQRVIWTDEQRQQVLDTMIGIIVREGLNPERFSFPTVVLKAQEQLKFSERGLLRKFFANKEYMEARAKIKKEVDARARTTTAPVNVGRLAEKFTVSPLTHVKNKDKQPGPVSITRFLDVKPAAAPQPVQPVQSVPVAPQEPSVSQEPPQEVVHVQSAEPKPTVLNAVTKLVEAASELGTLFLAERHARTELEFMFSKQQSLIGHQQMELTRLRKSLEELEEFVLGQQPTQKTEAQAMAPRFEPLESQTKELIKKKLPRVHVFGMETRNHAYIATQFAGKLDLSFHVGDSDKLRMNGFQPNDSMVLMLDFMGHTLSNQVMDIVRRQGLKDRVRLVHGGMSSLQKNLTDLLEAQ